MEDNIAKVLATRQHEEIKNKMNVWNLIYDAYKGGDSFITKDNLFQYRIEDNMRFNQRLKRADYTNHTATLIDMIVGFIYSNAVSRDIPEKYSYIKNNIYKGKSIQSFMNMVATSCLKSTVGILVDSPKFEIDTEAERIANDLNPYVVFYHPSKICDFEEDDKGNLEWIILDNSHLDKTDPKAIPEQKIIKRLWTKEYYQDIETVKSNGNKKEFVLHEEVSHDLGEIPFIFVNSRDIDGNNITDSPFEDIVLKSRTIFNINSWATEVLASSSFQLLLFPYENQNDLDNIAATFDPSSGGIGDLPVVPFKALSQRPSFEAPDIDLNKFIEMVNHLSSEILSKFGMKPDEKGSWESGVAKSISYHKTEAILRSISIQLENAEKEIIRLCGLYEGTEIPGEIEYSLMYEKNDIEKELSRLERLFKIPSQNIKDKATREMIKLSFPTMEDEELDNLLLDTQETQEVPEVSNTEIE